MAQRKFSAVELVSAETKEAIRRKSAANLPDAPRGRSYTPAQIKGAMVRPILDTKDSAIAEIDRVAAQVNRALSEVEEAMTETPDETGVMQPGSGVGSVAQLGGNEASGMQSAALGKESYAASPIGTTEGYLTTVVPCTRYLTDEVSMDYDAATGKLTFAYAGEGEAPEGNVFVVYRCYIVELDNYIYRRAKLDALPAQIELSAEGTIDADADGSFFMNLLFAGEVDGEVMDGTITKESLYAPRAVGYATVAVGKGAEASGYLTVAWKPCSHAEGYRTRAMGDAAHAEGAASEALSDRAHAEGNTTVASGAAAHSEGGMTRARGDWTHAEGFGTVADAWSGHVQGCYNEIDTDKKYLHIVGNGSSEEHRSNAHTLDKAGNAWYAGSVACRAPRSGSEAVTLDYAEDMLAGRLTDSVAFLRCAAGEDARVGGSGIIFSGEDVPPGKEVGDGSYCTTNVGASNAVIVSRVHTFPKDARATGLVGIWLKLEYLGDTSDAHGFIPVDTDWDARLSGVSGSEVYAANKAGADASFIVRNTAGVNDTCRFCDKAGVLVYRFDLTKYPNAVVILEILQNYRLEVSPDNENWVLVQDYAVTSGERINSPSNVVSVGIDSLRWAPGAAYLYIRLSNTDTTLGFGGAIRKFTIRYGTNVGTGRLGQSAALLVELTSSGKPDVNEISFRLGTDAGVLRTGWHFYVLDLLHSAAGGLSAPGSVGYLSRTGGEPDLSALNFLRVYGSWGLWRIGVGTCAVLRRAGGVTDTEFILPAARVARGQIIGTGGKALTLNPGFVPSRIVLRATRTDTYSNKTYTQDIYESFTLSPARDGEYFFMHNASDYLGAYTDVKGAVWSYTATAGGGGVTVTMKSGFNLSGVTYDFYAEE